MSDQPPNLRDDDVDRLGKALLTLASELWTLKDRQRILEAVLEEKGLAVTELLDTYQPDTQLSLSLSKDRAAFIEKLLASLDSK